ncbi:ester cyclase [Flavobacterium sp. ENC]|uniref:ester cyclase n=1 Tax=Flavobacterium sp. ENC TaxID=2897330 RepID=UPI001E5EE93D|nr:ester cyclase [Flavobacterium sp. ENC]MCD0467011.1 ester cyclase [Flavobacterium sp. ENC]
MKIKITILTLLISCITISAFAQKKEKTPDYAAIVRKFHDNYSKGLVEANGEMVDPNVIIEVNGGAKNKINGETFTGKEAFVEFLKRDKRMFKDGKLTHLQLITQGREVAVRFYMEGTHTGPIQTPDGVIEPTGKKVHLEVTEFAYFSPEGKLLHVHTLYNTLGLLTQLKAK